MLDSWSSDWKRGIIIVIIIIIIVIIVVIVIVVVIIIVIVFVIVIVAGYCVPSATKGCVRWSRLASQGCLLSDSHNRAAHISDPCQS